MKIIAKSENLTPRDVYRLTMNGGLTKVKDSVGRRFTITDYVLYEDTDSKTGNPVELLSFVTDEGEAIATASKTVIRSFKAMAEIFPLPIVDVEVIVDMSKSGREYYNIVLA